MHRENPFSLLKDVKIFFLDFVFLLDFVKGRDCGDTVASQGTPRILLNQQKLEGKRKNSLLELLETGALPTS